MLGLEIINKVYKENSIDIGAKVKCGSNIYIVEKVNNGTALRECVSTPKRGKMVHNFSFSELLDFLNKECNILTLYTFSEAARRNRKMKPSTLDVDYMSLKEALAYLSSVSDASLLKALLEEEVWYA